MIAFVASLLLAAPGAASASHYNGIAESGPFNPSMLVGPTTATADASLSPSLYLETSQGDKEEVIRSHEITIPAGWRLSIGSIPNADAADVPSCKDASDSNLAANLEGIGGMRVKIHTNATRNPNTVIDPNDNSGIISNPPGVAIYDGGIWFHHWNPTPEADGSRTAILCGQVTTSNNRIPQADRVIMTQLELRLLPDTSWRLTWDFRAAPDANGTRIPGDRSVIDDAAFRQSEASILYTHFHFFERTVGNYNLCGTTCPNPDGNPNAAGYQGKSILFVQTPVTPGDYTIQGTFTPCAPLPPEGTGDIAACQSMAQAVTRQRVIRVTAPAGPFIREYAKLTGPRTGALMADQPAANRPATAPTFALLRNTSSVTFTWNQPPMNPAYPVKGYLLTIGPPGHATRHYEYMVTNAAHPGFDGQKSICGTDGLAPACSLTVTFPLSTTAGGTLPAEGKYAASLVTVYADGTRTDGRCDNDTGEGSTCPPAVAGFKVVAPGMSVSEFWITPKAWPNAYVETGNYKPSGSAGFTAEYGPRYVLFVDYALGEAQFLSWNYPTPSYESFFAQDAAFGQGDSGVVSFGTTFHPQDGKFRFDGFTAAGGCSSANMACGTYTRYKASEMNAGNIASRGPQPLAVQATPTPSASLRTPFSTPTTVPGLVAIVPMFVDPFEGIRIP